MHFLPLIVCVASVFVFFFIICKNTGLHNKDLDLTKKSHKALILLGTVLCLLSAAFLFANIYKVPSAYPFGNTLINRNAYEQQFDAFIKHQLYFDIPASDGLLSLADPYSPGARENVTFLWDRAFYNGQYYSYFGVAPILTVYFPFYFLTGKVPSASIVCFIFAVITIISIAFLYVKAIRLFCKKANLVLSFFGLFAVELGSFVLMLLVSADMYYIAMISGLCNLVLFLLFAVSAYQREKLLPKCIEFCLSGIFLVLTVMSRPNMALMAVIIIPMLLQILVSKNYKAKSRFLQLASFAVPVLIGAAVQMWYNSARFSSPFDFGSAYQLTVADTGKYVITPLLFIPAIYHYFCQMPEIKTSFPFFHLSADGYKGDYTGYIYLTRMMGAFNFPAAYGLFLIPVNFLNETEKWKRWFFGLGFIMPVVVAILNMCLGGLNIRYLADIIFTVIFIGTLTLLNLYNMFDEKKKNYQFIAFIIITVLLVISAFMASFMTIENERFSNF